MKQLKYHLLQKNSICRVLRTVECILISAFLYRLGPVTCRILRNLFVPIPLYFQKLQIKLLRIFSKSMKKGKSVKTTRNYRFKYYYQGTNERIVIREILRYQNESLSQIEKQTQNSFLLLPLKLISTFALLFYGNSFVATVRARELS